ncbi:MAG: VacJ family lipoprotein [Pseudomonadales bacterium]|nr:VacJ family lipoprotein [Pseudomonadales bacterium]
MNTTSTSTGQLLPALLTMLLLSLPAQAQAQEDDDDFFVFDEEETSVPTIADPLEPFNRAMFAFNDKLYRVVLKPVVVVYRKVPTPVRASVNNFLENLGGPVSAINALLQLEFKNAGTELARFVVNSTLGIGGLFDPASDMNLVKDDEDLGQTLQAYGIGHGFYLVIPFLGSSSLKDGISLVGNAFIDPVFQIVNPETEETAAILLVDAETTISLDKDTYEAFYKNALDPYIFFRSAYVQNRAGRVQQ